MNTITLQAKATPTDDGFDILAISEGIAKGHNIKFSANVLLSAMPLYSKRPVFIDHVGLFESPSVRNLAGTLDAPTWNDIEHGIQAKLTPAGPAADVLLSLKNAARQNPAIMEAVGFSTVLNVKLDKEGNVLKIVDVKSVDLVIDPARGGKFLSSLKDNGEVTAASRARRAHNPLLKGVQMKKKVTQPAAVLDEEPEVEETETLNEETRAALALQGANEITAQLQEEQKMQRDIHIANLTALLDTSLAGSKLPTASQKAIRKPFEAKLAAGELFKPTDLQEAIAEKREELAELSAGSSVQGPSRSPISGMFNSADQFKAALSDLLGAPRDKELENLKTRRLTGIREAYLIATGDDEFHGGYYPEFALATVNFPGAVANVQNKILVKAWKDFEEHYGWWKKIVTIEHFNNLNDVSWIRTGTIASLPTVAERGEYTELPIGDIRETSSWNKYGGYVPLTIEAVLRDDVRAFARMPIEVALAGIRNISEQVAAIFTSNNGVGPTMADGGALFNSTPQTTAGGHINLLTTPLGTNYTAWDAVALAMFNKKLMVKNAIGYYGTGKKQAIYPSICLVPADLAAAANALFVPRWEAPAQNVPATQSVLWGGRVDPVTVPEWTDPNDWAAVIDPKLRPGIMLGEIFGVMPQIFSAASEIDPAMFANDESRIKVRHFLTVGVADDMPLHKSNV